MEEAVTSKAARIRAMYDQNMATREIAKVIFSTDKPTEGNLAYVRVSGRQRNLPGGTSQNDINWRLSKFGSLRAYYDHRNTKTRESRLSYYKRRWRDDPAYRASQTTARRLRRQRKRLAEARESV